APLYWLGRQAKPVGFVAAPPGGKVHAPPQIQDLVPVLLPPHKCFRAPLRRSPRALLDEKRCNAQREFAFPLAARGFSVAQNTHVSEPTKGIRRCLAPSNRKLALESGSRAETNSAPRD